MVLSREAYYTIHGTSMYCWVSYQCTPSVVVYVNSYVYKVTLCALWWVRSEDGVAGSPSTAGSAADDCCAGAVTPAAA